MIILRSQSILTLLSILLCLNLYAQPTVNTQRQYLSGIDKDHTIPWDFFCTKGRNSGKWTTIPVPSNWELQGFGEYTYGRGVKKIGEQGLYKYTFTTSKEWRGKKIFIVFEGSMTDTEVKVNGKLAGPIHQGGFYQFKYDVSGLIKPGAANLLEVKVSKISANESIYHAESDGDFWAMGGIFRPVYLEVKPASYIDRVAIDAEADGSFRMDVYTGNVSANHTVDVQVQELNGEKEGDVFSNQVTAKQNIVSITNVFPGVKLWSPEDPNLYEAIVSLKDKRGVVHTIRQRFGFRTVEVRKHDGIYVNGARIIFKGVNRHSFWPESGRTLSKEISLLDVNLIKDMNMNAVRMSHYPPDQHFLDVCDSLGLFVLDELTGWQAKYDTEAGRKLVKELVVRDVNHPSIVLWANGNEGGWNTALDDDFPKYDIQQRFVYHPWEKFRGTDTKHYPDYNYVTNSVLYGNEIYFPTEFMHGLYDGGHAAGLDDFWSAMLSHPFGAGGFLWSFHDEGVVRHDRQDSIDTNSNSAPDGIVGPHREKEGSFFAVKEIWSPVYIGVKSLPSDFDGSIPVENRYSYTNLDKCNFRWKLVSLASPHTNDTGEKIDSEGKSQTISLAPGTKGFLKVSLPAHWRNSDVLYLTASDPHKREIFTWSWPLKSPAEFIQKVLPALAVQTVQAQETSAMLTVTSGDTQYIFDKATGYLEKVIEKGTTISLSKGPVQAGVTHKLKQFNHRKEGSQYIVEPIYEGETMFTVKWTFASDKSAKLDYSYSQKGEADFMGISFKYPEDKITGMKWLGQGPYRVWKNRLKGMQFGIWEKKYNNTVTGESWDYPEFKGYHAKLYWVNVISKEAPFTIYTENENTFLQMLKPLRPKGAYNEFNNPPFPEGDISFLQAIAPIGTKFQDAKVMGPQSQKNIMMNYTPISGTLWFDFGTKNP
ncbi:glycoside hydrolase family 2 TIM barrel-domain containing protein [Ohtaekwangia koreensis]|uniref:beta-galactosidase n=1 Tax=Ohtaekwangia koreensis TaxID=688867 RepID=A0A1T5MGU2_9BACT|nr:glycoside hydrolase family 2 TIM barrel-domain containing protein [Ohtaekwangia koreensis]SKC87457.1 Beta galactosidase small chain [Ohtaekwangia koreensis]